MLRNPKYTCPHCGAPYEVRKERKARSTYHIAVCSYCGDVMAEWEGCARHYRRIGRPSSVTRATKVVAEAAGTKPPRGKRARSTSRRQIR
jgi:predicted RNA-binding Zn-ribbon protein involved in translation (DUF1610 family)